MKNLKNVTSLNLKPNTNKEVVNNRLKEYEINCTLLDEKLIGVKTNQKYIFEGEPFFSTLDKIVKIHIYKTKVEENGFWKFLEVFFDGEEGAINGRCSIKAQNIYTREVIIQRSDRIFDYINPLTCPLNLCYSEEISMKYFITNILCKELSDVWDEEKNAKNGVYPEHLSRCSDINIYLKGINGESYKVNCSHYVCKTNLICNNCRKKNQCKACINTKLEDSLYHRNRELSDLIISDVFGFTVDTKKVLPNAHIYVISKCKSCGKKIHNPKRLDKLNQGYCNCERCSKGITLPARFMMALLSYLKIINYKREKTFKWSINVLNDNPDLCGTKRYDFHIPWDDELLNKLLLEGVIKYKFKNLILELQGRYHYYPVYGIEYLIKTQENDTLKLDLAKKNLDLELDKTYFQVKFDYKNTPTLNQMISYVKNGLGEIFNLENLNQEDWNKIWEDTIESLTKTIVDLFKEGYSETEIAEILKVSEDMVYRKLKYADSVGIFHYDSKKNRKDAYHGEIKIILVYPSGEIKDIGSIKAFNKMLGISHQSYEKYIRNNNGIIDISKIQSKNISCIKLKNKLINYDKYEVIEVKDRKINI